MLNVPSALKKNTNLYLVFISNLTWTFAQFSDIAAEHDVCLSLSPDHLLWREKLPGTLLWVCHRLLWSHISPEPMQLLQSGEWYFCGLWPAQLHGSAVPPDCRRVSRVPEHHWLHRLHPILPRYTCGKYGHDISNQVQIWAAPLTVCYLQQRYFSNEMLCCKDLKSHKMESDRKKDIYFLSREFLVECWIQLNIIDSKEYTMLNLSCHSKCVTDPEQSLSENGNTVQTVLYTVLFSYMCLYIHVFHFHTCFSRLLHFHSTRDPSRWRSTKDPTLKGRRMNWPMTATPFRISILCLICSPAMW